MSHKSCTIGKIENSIKVGTDWSVGICLSFYLCLIIKSNLICIFSCSETLYKWV